MYYNHPAQMEPLFPTGGEKLTDLATELIRGSAALGGQLHPITRATIIDLLRIINSYYSNRIEGHNTTPIDIERAMQEDYADDSTQRALQIESRIHIEVQKEIESRLDTETMLNVSDIAFITFIHREFYQHLPIELRSISDPQTGEQLEVKAGELRTRQVKVGLYEPMPATGFIFGPCVWIH
jgi:Fic family protein